MPEPTASVVDRYGLRRDVPISELQRELELGARTEDPTERAAREYREQAGLTEDIKAAVEGAASTATFGLSSQLAAEIGGDEYKKAAQRREQLPARSIGEVLGLAAPWGAEALGARALGTGARIATAAPRAVTRVAGVAGETAARLVPGTGRISQVLGGAARVGAEGAVEGAAFSVGRLIEDNALRDKDLSIENVLAAAGHGASTGALLGAGIGAAAPIARAGAERLATAAASRLPAGEGLAGRFAFRATGATGSQVQKLGLKRAESSGRRLLDEGLMKVEGLPQRAERIAAAAKEAGEQVGAAVKRLDDAGVRPDLAGIVSRADEHLRALRSSGLKKDLKLANKLDDEWVADLRKKLETGNDVATFESLWSRRVDMDDWARGKLGKEGDELRSLRGVIEEEFERQAGSLGGPLASEYKAAKSRYSDLIAASNVATPRAAAIAGHALPSLRATITGAGALAGGVAALGTPGAALGLVTAAGAQAFVKHGDAAIALALDKLAALRQVEQQANKAALRIASDTQAAVRKTAVSGKQQLPTAIVKTQQEYERHTELARAYKANPAKAAAMVGAELGALDRAAPKATVGMSAARAQDAAYLAARLPPQAPRILPGPPSASPAAMAAVTRAAVALEDPQSVAASMKDNRLSPEAADAIRERRPEIFEAMTRNVLTVITELAKRGELPDYQARIQISMLLGQPIDPTLEPRRIAMVQQLVHQARFAPAAPAPPRGSGNGARNMASRRATEAESIGGLQRT